ncbi:uncharacterized protein B4U80_10156 [Leptotrombidium deliense]|uniref:THAP-type domain-containing protein n=1 Tax=Leptotrombidium deliense TaxID=299467 RepID=A0A443SS00_9ACAR|nr:uncharacterized protein B4U80_10156 [Leptotrombidium deliense]
MVLKRCAYGSCANDSSFTNKEKMKGVVFIRFPNAKLNEAKCKRWVDACNRQDFSVNDVNEDTYICSKHFVGGNGPTLLNPDPVSSAVVVSVTSQKLVDKTGKRSTVEKNARCFKKIKESCDIIVDKQIIQISNNLESTRNNVCFKKSAILDEDTSSCEKNIDLKLSKNVNPSLNSDALVFSHQDCRQESVENSSSVPFTMQSGASCQLVLSKLEESPNSNGVPILIKVLPSNSTNILPSAAVAVIPVKSKKVWMEKLNSSEFCFKWACLGLSVEFNGNWIFTSINGSLAEKQLKLSSYGECEVKVLGNSLSPDHLFFDDVASELNDERDFHCLMSKFARWKVCAGNDIVDNVFKDTVIAVRAFVCNLTQTLRSKYCELLVNGNGPIRCKECKMLLNRIRRLKYQKRRECDDKNFTDISENEQSQHSTSDHEIPFPAENDSKQPFLKDNVHVSMNNYSNDKLSLSLEDRSDDDAVPADFFSKNISRLITTSEGCK